MSPEQAAGKHSEVGTASDIYSLGGILYELLTGVPPFQGATVIDIVHQVIENEPAAPRLFNSRVPRDVETICLKCLRKNPSTCYASAEELADELRRFLNGEPIFARPVSYAGRIWRWSRRNPQTAGVLSTAVLFLFMVAVGGVTAARRLAVAHVAAMTAQSEGDRKLQLSLKTVGRFFDTLELNRTDGASYRPEMRGRLLEEAACFFEALTEESRDGSILYSTACSYAHFVTVIKNDGSLSSDGQEKRLAERYAARAIALLTKSREVGYFQDHDHVDNLKTEPRLDVLRSREDFKQLIAEL